MSSLTPAQLRGCLSSLLALTALVAGVWLTGCDISQENEDDPDKFPYQTTTDGQGYYELEFIYSQPLTPAPGPGKTGKISGTVTNSRQYPVEGAVVGFNPISSLLVIEAPRYFRYASNVALNPNAPSATVNVTLNPRSGAILRRLPWPVPGARNGLTAVSGFVAFLESDARQTVILIDPDSATSLVQSSYELEDPLDPTFRIDEEGIGLAWDGSSLWLSAMNSSELYVFELSDRQTGNAVLVDTCDVGMDGIEGLGFGPAGEFGLLWLSVNGDADKLFALDPAECSVAWSLPSPADGVSGVAFGSNSLWVAAHDPWEGETVVYQLNYLDGSVMDMFPLPLVSPRTGLAHDGLDLWAIDMAEAELVQIYVP